MTKHNPIKTLTPVLRQPQVFTSAGGEGASRQPGPYGVQLVDQRSRALSATHPKVLADRAYIRACILRGVSSQPNGRAIVALLQDYVDLDNQASASSGHSDHANLNAIFSAIDALGATDRGWIFSHYKGFLEVLWFELDDPWRTAYRELYSLTSFGQSGPPAEPTNYGKEWVKQEGIGMLGMMKGIAVGAAGLVDDAAFLVAGHPGENNSRATEWVSGQYDELGTALAGKDWLEGEVVLLGLSAREIGEVGGTLVFTLATAGSAALKAIQQALAVPAAARSFDGSLQRLARLATEDRKPGDELASDPLLWQEMINIVGTALGLFLSRTSSGQRIGTKLAHFLLDAAPVAPIAGKIVKAALSDDSEETKTRAIGSALAELLQLAVAIASGRIDDRPPVARASAGGATVPERPRPTARKLPITSTNKPATVKKPGTPRAPRIYGGTPAIPSAHVIAAMSPGGKFGPSSPGAAQQPQLALGPKARTAPQNTRKAVDADHGPKATGSGERRGIPPTLLDLRKLTPAQRAEATSAALQRHQEEGRHVLLVAILETQMEFLVVSGSGGAAGHTEYVALEHLLEQRLIQPGQTLLFQGIHAPCPFTKCGMCSNVMALAALKLDIDIIYDPSALRLDLKEAQLANASTKQRSAEFDRELDEGKARMRFFARHQGQHLRSKDEFKDPAKLDEMGTAAFERMRKLIEGSRPNGD